MSADEIKTAHTNQTIEVWKTTVGTQQHFNTLQLQLRNYALTLFLATLTAAGYAIKENLSVSIIIIACLGGCAIVCAFYYMDWGYHQLLKGAVEHGKTVEEALKNDGLNAGLAQSIGAASRGKFLWGIPSTSTQRLHWFYRALLIALAGTAAFGHFATSGKKTDPAARTGKADSTASKQSAATLPFPTTTNTGCGTEALRSYYDSGKYLMELRQTAELGKRRLVEELRNLPKNAKPAAVFDIDDTALSSWPILLDGQFCWDAKRFYSFVAAGKASAIEPVLDLYRFALSNKVDVFFVTQRNESYRSATETNLAAAGFSGYREIIMKPDGSTVRARDFKNSARQKISGSGWKVVMSVGDQLADLGDASANEGLLIPNPFYTVN